MKQVPTSQSSRIVILMADFGVGAKNNGNAVDGYAGIVVLNLNGDTSKRSRFDKIQS